MNRDFPGLPGKFATPYSVSLYQATGPTLTTATLTLFAWDNEIKDAHNMHNNVISNSRITIVTAGLYEILARIRFFSNTTGIRETEIYLNGTAAGVANIIGINTQGANPTGLTTVTAICTRNLVTGDYLEVMGYQNSGGNLQTEGGIAGYQNGFSAVRIG